MFVRLWDVEKVALSGSEAKMRAKISGGIALIGCMAKPGASILVDRVIEIKREEGKTGGAVREAVGGGEKGAEIRMTYIYSESPHKLVAVTQFSISLQLSPDL
jgi:hypothetical protein